MRKLLIILSVLIYCGCNHGIHEKIADFENEISQKEIADAIEESILKTKNDSVFADCKFVEFRVVPYEKEDSIYEHLIFYDVFIHYIPQNEIHKLYDNSYSVCKKLHGKRILSLRHTKSHYFKLNRENVTTLIKSEYPDFNLIRKENKDSCACQQTLLYTFDSNWNRINNDDIK